MLDTNQDRNNVNAIVAKKPKPRSSLGEQELDKVQDQFEKFDSDGYMENFDD